MILGQEELLEKEMATHSKGPGGLQTMGSQELDDLSDQTVDQRTPQATCHLTRHAWIGNIQGRPGSPSSAGTRAPVSGFPGVKKYGHSSGLGLFFFQASTIQMKRELNAHVAM